MSNAERHVWTCASCASEQTHEVLCENCDRPRGTFAVIVAEHIGEHLADGIAEPLEMLKAMNARPCWSRIDGGRGFTLSFIAQQMRLLTKDTTALARQIAKARASRTMLDVLETGDTKDKLAVLKGIQVLGDVVEHKGEVTTRFVVETHEGSPPPVRGEA